MSVPKLEPRERTDEHFVAKHASLLNLAGRGSARAILLGDSLTRRWEDYPAVWQKSFGHDVLNFGVGSDTLETMLWRVRHGEFDGVNPRVVALMAGTNDLPVHDPVWVASGLAQLVDELASLLPSARLLLQGLLPRNPADGRDYPRLVREVNGLLARWQRPRVDYVDWSSLFSAADGLVSPDVMPDGLHLNERGYDRLGPHLAAALDG